MTINFKSAAAIFLALLSVFAFCQTDSESKLPKIGTKASIFTLASSKGKQVSLANEIKKNKATIVNFWFYG